MDLRVLHEAAGFLVVDKPAGLLSVPGRGPDKSDCAVSRAAAKFGWVRETHRLDQATSGILLLARNPEVHRFLSAAFAERRVGKSYAALLPSFPADMDRPGLYSRDGRIVLFQRLDPENRPRQIVDAMRGKEAITLWRGVDGASRFTTDSKVASLRVELIPLTGRTHQLRLALSSCGAPVYGDRLYAPPEIRDAAPRLMLHAQSIRFPHPDGGEDVEVSSIPEF